MILSKGNTKIGKDTANISMTPIESCKGCAEHCGKDCYALKAYRRYPNVKKAWAHNFEQACSNPTQYFAELEAALQKYKGKFFRWHVGGDILNNRYFNHMVALAIIFPNIRFLAFTKQYEIVNVHMHFGGFTPNNLQIVFSAWPTLKLDNPYDFPVAFMQDGTETRLNGTEIECPGSCEGCGMCWSLGELKRNVVFHKH